MYKYKYPKNYFITRRPALTKIPDHLIFKETIKYSSGIEEDCFTAISTKNPKERAVMYCYPEQVYRRDMGWVNSLYISYLDAMNNPRKGLGTMLLNIAREYSIQLGFNGRLHVDASSVKNKEELPHVFYKKFGMNTGRPKIDEKLDWFIQTGKDATYLDFKIMSMFYPPIQYNVKDKTPFLKRIMKSISQFFSLTNRIKIEQ